MSRNYGGDESHESEASQALMFVLEILRRRFDPLCFTLLRAFMFLNATRNSEIFHSRESVCFLFPPFASEKDIEK